MARFQYRIAGTLEWMSNSGNALLAITNPLGSGRKLTIRSFELNNLSSSTTANPPSVMNRLQLSRATVDGGDEVIPVQQDSNGEVWPSTVHVTKNGAISAPSAITRILPTKQLNPTTTSLSRLRLIRKVNAIWSHSGKDDALEPVTIRPGEGLALHSTGPHQHSLPIRVTATLTRNGTPDRTWSLRFFTSLKAEDQAVFAVRNEAGSGEIITLKDIAIEEVGTYDSPYFQLVPIGSTVDADAAESARIIKMDSEYPDPDNWIQAKLDVPILPFGLPENALSDASTGAPKGFNYLKTKDFLGPLYRAIFPEAIPNRIGSIGDTLFRAHRTDDVGMRKAGVTIREGEGLALVSGAETAVATTAVAVSGWSSFEIAVVIDVEPSFEPTLTITGLKNPSEVRIFEANTTNEVAGQETVTSGTFSWVFDPELTPAVDIAILSLGYQNLRLPNTALSLADLSIPVQQQIDRQYSNG